MLILKVKNAHEALSKVIGLLRKKGKEYNSRNGKVIRFLEPLSVQYTNPLERYEFWGDKRNSNPFFLFFESMWMLGGQNKLNFVDYFAPMSLYSDDGKTLNAAYGHRWRKHFNFDQVNTVINDIIEDKNSRRLVIQMWDPEDINSRSWTKDMACNMIAVFDVQLNKNNWYELNMTVYNRSNDCLSGDEELLSFEDKYTLKQLSDRFKSGELKSYEVVSYNEISNLVELDTCTNVWEVGEKDVIELIFKNKSSIKCTLDHKFLTKNRGWVEAVDLDAEDEMICLGYNNSNYLVLRKVIGKEVVYDFSIEKNHNSVLRGSSIVAHNCVFGLSSANAVHFSYLQEYIAKKCNIKVGTYHQVTNNGHAYIYDKKEIEKLPSSLKVSRTSYNNIVEFFSKYNKSFKVRFINFLVNISSKLKFLNAKLYNIYRKKFGKDYLKYIDSLDFASDDFDEDLRNFFFLDLDHYIKNFEDLKRTRFKSKFFNQIFHPLFVSFIYHKNFKDKEKSLEWIEKCYQLDIKTACKEWILRRKYK